MTAGTNNFLPFATGGSANVINDATYAALSAVTNGFASGIAQSQQLNKVWRQSSVMAAVLGQIIANNGVNASDSDGTSTLVTNLLAAIMAGNGTTPAQFDNTTKVATTAFVQRALGNLQGYRWDNANTTLTSADAGRLIIGATSTSFTYTLPSAAACPIGSVFHIRNLGGSGNITVQAAGSDSIEVYGGAITSVVLKPGDSLDVMSLGSGTVWYASGGSAQLTYSNVWFNNQVGFGTSTLDNNRVKIIGPNANQTGAAQLIVKNSNEQTRISMFANQSDNSAGLLLGGSLINPEFVIFTNDNIQGNNYVLRLDSNGVLKFNSGYGSVATAYGCRAWVNFVGNGSNAANSTINGSGNVSSVYKNGTGQWTINFATALPDATYCGSTMALNGGSGPYGTGVYNSGTPNSGSGQNLVRSTTQFGVGTQGAGGYIIDAYKVDVAIFR